jgi:hypothetical protein
MDLSKYGIPGGLSYKEYNSQTQPYQIFNFFNGITNNKIETNNLPNLQFGGGESEKLSDEHKKECNSVYLIFNHPAFETDINTIIEQLKENPKTDDVHKIQDLQSLFAEMKAMSKDEEKGEETVDISSSDDDDEYEQEDDEDELPNNNDDSSSDEEDDEEDEDDKVDELPNNNEKEREDDESEYEQSQDNESTASLGAILDMLKTHYSSAKSSSK